MAVRLEFLTQDPDEIELVRRYWAMSEEGAYLEKVSDLLPFRDVTQSGLIAKHVRQYCLAYDENQVCSNCDGPMLVTSRIDPKKVFQRSSRPCDGCAEAIKQTEEAELQSRLEERIHHMCSKTISYDALPDDVCLLLLAMDALIAPRLAKGTFKEGECDALAPYGSELYLRRLYKEEIIADDPSAAKRGTYFIRDGQLKANWDHVEFFLPGDEHFGRGREALEKINERAFTDSEALSNLWLDYAVNDVIRYLLDQCRIYSHDLNYEDIENIKSTVRFGLRTYSVSQLWFVMWKVVKDAASLANREYYNRTKAAATIPNKIRKQLEKADHEGGISRSWDRPVHHLAGALGMVFSTLFEIDEHTKGRQTLEMFALLSVQSEREEGEELQALATSFMQGALECQSAVPAMDQFADFIRAGFETKTALEELLRRNPG